MFSLADADIPDGNAAGLSDRRPIASSIAQISSLRVRLRINGEFNGDLYGFLRHSLDDRTNFVVLLNRVGRSASNPVGYDHAGFDVVFDDLSANGDVHQYGTVTNLPYGLPLTGVWQPDGREADPSVAAATSPRTSSLTAFQGAAAGGDWTLFLADVESGGTNRLVSWGLEIAGLGDPNVTWAAPSDITYGTSLSASQLNASAGVAGSFAYNPPLGTMLNAGSGRVLTVIFTPANLSQYVRVTNTVALNVLPAPLTITARPASKVFGAPIPPLAADAVGFVAGDDTNDLTAPILVQTTASASSPVGSYAITPANAASPNYLITFQPAQLAVLKASVSASLTASPNPALPQQSVTLTFSVGASPPGAGVPSGAVQFKIAGLNVGSPVSLAAGVASRNAGSLPAGLYAVSAEYSGNSNFHGATNQLASPLLVNTPPIAGSDIIYRSATNGTKVSVADLMSNDSDADGHALTWISFSDVTPNGGAVSRSGDWIFYAPISGFIGADEFTYVIQDALGVTATGVVQVAVHEEAVPSPNLVIVSLGQGGYLLSFDGIPGKAYRIQFAEDLEFEVWNDLGTETANAAGIFQFRDTPADGTPQRYYRSVYP